MRILVTGNMGYVGPLACAEIRRDFPDAEIWGFDSGYFAHCLTNAACLPESLIDRQAFGDMRANAVDHIALDRSHIRERRAGLQRWRDILRHSPHDTNRHGEQINDRSSTLCSRIPIA